MLKIDGAAADDPAAARRALYSTLRQLPEAGGVLRLEREARRRSRLAVSFDEMLERTPDIATPAFDVVEESGGFQVRRYADFAVVRTERKQAVSADGVKLGEPTMAGAGAFQRLAGYIFGGNGRSEKMAMTTPVFTRDGQMEFVLPEAYWTSPDAAPPPAAGAAVEVAAVSEDLVAAAYFGGLATSEQVEKRAAALLEAVEASTSWVASGEPFNAAYNDPFTPPWKRRNEVLVAVSAAEATS